MKKLTAGKSVRLVFVASLVLLALGLALLPPARVINSVGIAAAQGGLACSRTYTFDADFDQGTLLNVNHTAPNNNQLQLNLFATPLPFVYIANSARGTAVRLDVNTGAILGEYLTSPNGMGRDPSRTTVDKFGNVWVSNRAESGVSGGQNKGSVTRIGVILGGTRSNADGTPNPTGQYLKPPFQYNTCIDRNGDGLIKTSTGLANILPWTNAGAADTHGGVSTAEDECIINYTRVTGTNTRTVAVDANNDVWVGGLGDLDHEKISGVTGLPIPGTQFNLGCGGYGGLIDGNGVLWSARGGAGLLRFVPNAAPPPAGSGTCLGNCKGNYGLGIDPNTGHIWHSSLECDNRLYELNAAGAVVNSYAQPFGAQGVVVDKNSHVWMAEIFGSRVWHLAPNPAAPGTHYPVGIVSGFVGVTGVAVDANGKIWAAEINDRAARINPNAGAGPDANGNRVGAIDLTIPLGAGAGPYNYSDMTGFVNLSSAPSGTWTVIHDGGVAGAKWGTVSWNGSTPAGTNIGVEVRVADNVLDLTSKAFVAVGNGVSFCDIAGRFIEIRTTLSRNIGITATPILHDLTVRCCTTPLTVTVNNAFRNQGEANPPFSGSITGLMNGDNITATYSTTATIASAPGNYPITATLNDPDNKLGNYQVTNTPGVLKVFNSCGITMIPFFATRSTVGQIYHQPLNASPVGIYTFSMFAGNLPPGLQLVNNFGSYALQGTPTARGTFTFTILIKRTGSTCESLVTVTVTIQ